MNLEKYNTLCQDFEQKSARLTEWCESSTNERKLLKPFKVLRNEAQSALNELESYINENA
tara:strand:- start:1038 stop:1217 length:180 start_codon:yes stop_codon:yes gene_type:complete